MTLVLTNITNELPAMGAELAARARAQADHVKMARRWLAELGGQEPGAQDRLAHPARAMRAAIPTEESVDAVVACPGAPKRYAVAGVDGSQIEPDPHGIAYYHLVNVGSLIYRHGSGHAPEALSVATLGYSESDLYDDGAPVAGNLLDVRRDLAEIRQVADLCEAEARGAAGSGDPVPMVALVDGTLLLWVLDDRSPARQAEKAKAYLAEMDRIRATGAVLGAFTSRPRRTEVTRLLHLAHSGGDAARAKREPNPLERVPDRSVFEKLPPGARSALFLSPAPVNHQYYAPVDHAIYYCYINVAQSESDSVVARVEMPQWVAEDRGKLEFLHGTIVAQSRIVGDYPYVLARADELAFITGQERDMLTDMVSAALLREGLRPSLSPKANQKSMTRGSARRRA